MELQTRMFMLVVSVGLLVVALYLAVERSNGLGPPAPAGERNATSPIVQPAHTPVLPAPVASPGAGVDAGPDLAAPEVEAGAPSMEEMRPVEEMPSVEEAAREQEAALFRVEEAIQRLEGEREQAEARGDAVAARRNEMRLERLKKRQKAIAAELDAP
jgi:hypothetical protein